MLVMIVLIVVAVVVTVVVAVVVIVVTVVVTVVVIVVTVAVAVVVILATVVVAVVLIFQEIAIEGPTSSESEGSSSEDSLSPNWVWDLDVFLVAIEWYSKSKFPLVPTFGTFPHVIAGEHPDRSSTSPLTVAVTSISTGSSKAALLKALL